MEIKRDYDFSFFLVVIVTSSTAIPLDDGDISRRESFENEVDGYFQKDLSKLKNDDYACRDFYSSTCNKNTNRNVQQLKYKDHLESLYWSEVYNVLIEILNRPIRDIKNYPIDLERKLYQSCMKLGGDDDVYTNSIEEQVDDADFTIESTFNKILKVFGHKINEENWQKLDQKLALLGFKHSFFEVSVVKDPENRSKNIIRLSPPSMAEWNFKKLTDVVSDIFTQQQLDAYDYCKQYETSIRKSVKNNRVQSVDSAFWESNEKQDDDVQNTARKDETEVKPISSICEEFRGLEKPLLVTGYVKNSDMRVVNLLNRLVMIIFDNMDTANNDGKIQRLTIDELDKMYQKLVEDDTAEINWFQVLKSHFGNVNIHIKNSDNVLVENLPYFRFMAEVLAGESNVIIARAIRSKFVAENIRYYNWTKIYEINPVNKQHFCLEQNKFYGASAAVLERLKLKMKPDKNKVRSFLQSIVDSLHSNISNNKGSEMEKLKLLSHLKELTDKPLRSRDSSNITELYEGFESTGNYLLDINRYKSMFRRRNLLELHEAPLPLYRAHPFSVLEMENPRNRYTLHAVLNQLIYKKQFSISKDAVFGTFGVKSASFLFSLLKENSFENEFRDFGGILSITPRVSYNPETVHCFIKEDIVKYGYPADYHIITEVYGIRFAYDAMLHHSNLIRFSPKAMLRHSQSKSHEEFFTAYTEDNCKEDNRKIINKVLSNVHEFSTALQCSYNDSACNLAAFQFIEKDLISKITVRAL